MKITPLLASLSLAVMLIGCGKKTTQDEVSSQPEKKPPTQTTPPSAGQKQAAIKNSFWAVDQHLDQGGSLYLYLSTEQLLAKLDGFIDTMTAFAEVAGAEMDERAQQQMAMAIDMGRTAYEQSGLRDISGLGASSFALESGLNRNVLVLHHYAEKKDGLIWKLMGTAAHEQEVLKLLPANTAFAAHADADVVAGFNWLRDFITNTAPPEMVAEFAKGLAQANQTVNFENLLKSTDGELGFFITLDGQKRVAIPVPDAPAGLKIDFPEPALAVVLKVKDDQLLQLIIAQLKNLELAEMVKETKEGDVTLFTMTTPPLPVEIDVSPTLMMAGNYLILTSNTKLAKDILAVRSGKKQGLAGTAEFKRLAGDMNLKGNQLHFMSATISKEYGALMKTFMKAAEAEAPNRGPAEQQMLEMMKKFYLPNEKAKPSSQLAIMRVTAEGIVFESRNTGDGFESSLLAAGVIPMGVGAALLLPAIASARNKAREVQSAGNSKQLGVGLIDHAQDNDGQLPDADKWCAAILREVGTPLAFASPLDPATVALAEGGEKVSSYAFNAALSGKKLNELNPETVLIFETALGWNGSGGLKDAEKFMRTTGRASIAVTLVDGSTHITHHRELKVMRWKP